MEDDGEDAWGSVTRPERIGLHPWFFHQNTLYL
jgi:hypothetical protein